VWPGRAPREGWTATLYQIKSCSSRGGTAHAVYNAILQQSGQNAAACDFDGTAKVTTRNPFNPKRPRCLLAWPAGGHLIGTQYTPVLYFIVQCCAVLCCGWCSRGCWVTG